MITPPDSEQLFFVCITYRTTEQTFCQEVLFNFSNFITGYNKPEQIFAIMHKEIFNQFIKESAAIKAAPIYYKATMSFIEKSAALPEIMTLSSAQSQYRIPVRWEAWKAVMRDLFSRLHQ